MTVTMDAAGRIVIPKAIRDRERLQPGTELTITHDDGEIKLVRPCLPVRLERRGDITVLVPLGPAEPMTGDDVRAEIESIREERARLALYGEDAE